MDLYFLPVHPLYSPHILMRTKEGSLVSVFQAGSSFCLWLWIWRVPGTALQDCMFCQFFFLSSFAEHGEPQSEQLHPQSPFFFLDNILRAAKANKNPTANMISASFKFNSVSLVFLVLKALSPSLPKKSASVYYILQMLPAMPQNTASELFPL